jgi:hypothetical protein
VDLRGNTMSRGLQTDGQVALDRVEVALNSGGGILAGSTAELLLRNSMVAGNGATTEDAIVLTDADATVLYSSIAGFQDGQSQAISCTGGFTLDVRNSILLKRDVSGGALECTGATVTASHSGNINNTDGTAWFSGWPTNLRLTTAGKTEFGSVALWQAGDPATDIDGGLRPDTAGTPDVAGAHLGP